MKVVVVGSGAREHGLALSLGRDAEVIVTPGNPCIPRSVSTSVEELVVEGDIDLVVVGPEQPLVDGLADCLRAQGVSVFGPGADGAQLEGSKISMKGVLDAAGVPTAAWRGYGPDGRDAAVAFASYLLAERGRVVIKTDYLAAGKGVLVTDNLPDAKADIDAKLESRLKKRHILIEEPLEGYEVSVFAVCDGQRAVCLPAAQDFKRVGNGDTGLNTGGMGAWSRPPFLPDDLEEVVMAKFVEPTLAELRRRGIDYRGVLYVGLMITPQGPKLLEYNIRFGDPDSQVVLLRMTSSLSQLLKAAADGDLRQAPELTFSDVVAVLVVGAAEGYPDGDIRKGDVITCLHPSRVHGDLARQQSGVLYAGVASDGEGNIVTAGGRVLNAVGFGEEAVDARRRAYDVLAAISWEGMQYRDDIALPK